MMPTDNLNKKDGVENSGLTPADQDLASGGLDHMETDGEGKEIEEDDTKARESGAGKEVEDNDILVMPGSNKAAAKEYTGNVPPPPVKLYHRAQAQVMEIIDGKIISYIKISYKKNLKK